ncbi:hypothetical protein CLV47_12343 [Antricoccus suffuscus]|uniref:TrbL/VirB6 plasmid conjugal transfer protein n=1 Tax=Antricoccus suffuscus TaxID=1629062 RepID=A0A2T0ZES3_9ACTN|nr:hypothetical protein [Antricoccus suffuscus]PRZ34811.1 hypothetical protein CLV47_12343 [Antricoccus suffuscus]
MRSRRRLLVLAALIVALTVGAPVVAHAAPPPQAIDAANPSYPDQFPDYLKKFVWGSAENTSSYADKPCTSDITGEQGSGFAAGQYLLDFAAHAGGLLFWSMKKSGEDPPQFDYRNPYKDPIKGPPGVVSPVPMSPEPFAETLQSGCASDLATFGTPNPDSMMGFDFISKPDAQSVKYIEQHATSWPGGVKKATDPYPAPTNNEVNAGWDAWAGTLGIKSDFSNLCDGDGSAGVSLCGYASFLDCSKPGAGNQDAIDTCKAWNLVTAYTIRQLASSLTLDDQSGFIGGMAKAFTAVLTLITTVPVAIVDVGYHVAAGAVWLAYKIVEVAADIIKCVSDQGDTCIANWTAKAFVASLELIPKAAEASSFSVADLTNSALTPLWSQLLTLAFYLVMILFLGSVILSAIRLRLGDILISFVGLLKFAVFAALGLTAVAVLIEVTDAISDFIAGGQGTAAVMTQFKNMMIEKLTGAGQISGVLLVAIFAVFGTIAAVIIWVQFFFRNVWILLAITVIILQAAGLAGWEATRKWTPRALNALWLVLLVKPMTVLVFAVSMNLIGNGDGLSDFIGGVVVLIMAAVLPPGLVKLFSLVGSAIGSGQLGGSFTGRGSSAIGSGLAGAAGGYGMSTFARNAPGASVGAKGATARGGAAAMAGGAAGGAARLVGAAAKAAGDAVSSAGGVHGGGQGSMTPALASAASVAAAGFRGGGSSSASRGSSPAQPPSPAQDVGGADSAHEPSNPTGAAESSEAQQTRASSSPGASSAVASDSGGDPQISPQVPDQSSPRDAAARTARPPTPPVTPLPSGGSSAPGTAEQAPQPPLGPAPPNGRW